MIPWDSGININISIEKVSFNGNVIVTQGESFRTSKLEGELKDYNYSHDFIQDSANMVSIYPYDIDLDIIRKTVIINF